MLKKFISFGVGAMLLATPVVASADVASQIEALRLQIAQLTQLLAQLIAQKAAQQGGQGAWCHTFTTDLQYGDSTSERDGSGDTQYLHEALKREGWPVDVTDNNGRWIVEFGESTRAAVIKFQAKYGIKQTGYVGPLTRAQLNYLYGCKDVAYGADAGFDDFGVQCNAIVNGGGQKTLKMGDTDASTGGRVSKLQTLLGIPATGEYDSRTRTVYVAKCTSNTVDQSLALGMSMYVDRDFGFSFWYPSGWIVTKKAITNPSVRKDGAIAKSEITLTDPSQDPSGLTITEYYSENRALATTEEACGPAAGCPYFARYYFDPALHTWMQYETYTYPGGTPLQPDQTFPADVSSNTMGGLHMFSGLVRHGGALIVPLTARNFLYIENAGVTGDPFYAKIVNTIVATDPAVATPVTAPEQMKAILRAKDYYVGR